MAEVCKSTFILLFLFIISGLSVNSQINTDAERNPSLKPPCLENELNLSNLFIRNYDSKYSDSIYEMIESIDGWWQEVEPVFRMKILLDILQNRFDENNYGVGLLDYLLNYSEINKSLVHAGLSRIITSKCSLTMEDFESFTDIVWLLRHIADSCTKTLDNTKEEYLISRYYTGDTAYFFNSLRNQNYAGSIINEEYHRRAKEILNSSLGSIYCLTGIWQGIGKYDFFGTHPQVGIGFSAKKMRFFCDLVILFRFLNSKEPYFVCYRDEVAASKSFHDFYMGVEPGYGILKRNRYQFELLGGVGYETIGARKYNDKETIRWLRSLNINGGIGLKYFYDPFETRYIAVQLRLIHTGFDRSVDDNLTGEAVSLRFIWAFLKNQRRGEIERLHYF